MIRMWVVELLIQEIGDETMEEVGEDYLLELSHGNMIQVATRNFCGRNDLLQDLTIKEVKKDMLYHVHRKVDSAL